MTEKKIPLFKVYMGDHVSEDVAATLESGQLAEGPRVAQFEERLREYLEAPGLLATNSCTSALEMAMTLAGVRPGTDVVTTPMTCSATIGAIVHHGANIIWADVDESGRLKPSDVANALTPQTKAVVAVDWGGTPCDYDALRSVVGKIPIIEDAAHAFGATYDGEPIAQVGGDYVCWSFQAIKHLTCGDGGALLVPSEQRERARLMRWFGLDRTKGEGYRCGKQDITEAGYKYHMNDIAATIGLGNLSDMDWVLNEHRGNAEFYGQQLHSSIGSGLLSKGYPGSESSWWIYTILVGDREGFMSFMAEHGITTSPVHSRADKHTAFQSPCVRALPGVDYFSNHAVALPCGWWVTPEDRGYILETVRKWQRR